MNFIRSLIKLLTSFFSEQTGRYFLILLIICSTIISSQSGKAQQSGEKNNLTQITFQLPWHHQFQFAGYYAAIEQNYYKDAGFNVTVKSGSPTLRPVAEVLSGHADYGVARSELLLHRLHGKPLVALAAVFQHSALVFLTKKDSEINTPQDMIGRRVMLLPGDDAAEYLAVFRNEGIAPDQVDIIPSSFEINDLLDGKTDVFNAYVTNEPYYLKQLNISATVLKPSTYGIDFYGDTLFTSEQKINTLPDQVKRFRQASLRGWKYAMKHPAAIINLLKNKYNVAKSIDHLHFEAEAMRKLILPDLIEIGHMNPGRWHHMAETYVQLDMADPGYSLDSFIYNPNPGPDFARFYRLTWTVIILFVLAGIVMLVYFNRRLKQMVRDRTSELASHEVRFRELFNNINSGIAIYKAIGEGNDFIFQELNPAGLRSSKLQRQQVLNKSVREVFPGVVKIGLFEVFQRVWRTGLPEYLPTTNYKDQRIELWVENYVCKLPSGEIVAVYDDVTNRKRAEDKLRLHSEIISNMAEGVYLIRLEDVVIVYANPKFEKMFGYDPGEMIGMHASRVNAPAEKNPKETAEEILGIIHETGEWHGEVNNIRKDGTPFWCYANVSIFDHPQFGRVLVAVHSDITDRKQAESQLRQSKEEWERTFNSFIDVVTLQNPDLSIIKANQAASTVLGLPLDKVIGHHCYELFLGREGPCRDCPLLETRDKFKSYSREMWHEKSEKTFLVSAAPVFNERGKLAFIAHVAKDISESKKLEAQLLQSQKMESIGNLAGGVAHDFNNILTVINMHSEVAQEELEEGSDLWIDLEEIRKAGERATNLTHQLLAFSRKQLIIPRSVNINKLIPNLKKMLTRLISEDIHLETILDKQLGRIYADPGQLDQIIINLVVNARDAIKKQPDATKKIIKVSTSQVFMDNEYVACHPGSSQGWHLQLQVEDSGSGMSEEIREHIFEPFYTTKATGEGTGMGLATVYGIVKQNKGSIYVYSEPGQGTIFKVYWPIKEEEVVAEVDHEPQPAKGGSEVILLAEDSKPLREITSRQLRKAGYTVIDAGDGRKALEKAAAYQGAIDLLFTDVIMPVMGGKELSEKIKELYPGIIVLFASGYTDNGIHQDILALGKNRFINKPYSKQDILIRIRQLLDNKES